MTDQEQKALIEEAADIFIRFRDDPDNPEYLEERASFLQRGRKEREIYLRVTRSWAGAGQRVGQSAVTLSVLAMVVAVSVFLIAEPLRFRFMADLRTGHEPQSFDLVSGDGVFLDAETMISENTSANSRQLRLFDGAAVFDVVNDGRPFVVDTGDLQVSVYGTVFEVEHGDDTVSVSVLEGAVGVSFGQNTWSVEAGQRLSWSDDAGADVIDLDPVNFAPWRQDRLVADGMSFAEVAKVIERRLPGRIIITSEDLAQSRVSGTIDLSKPELALEALAATRNARRLSVPVLGNLLFP